MLPYRQPGKSKVVKIDIIIHNTHALIHKAYPKLMELKIDGPAVNYQVDPNSNWPFPVFIHKSWMIIVPLPSCLAMSDADYIEQIQSCLAMYAAYVEWQQDKAFYAKTKLRKYAKVPAKPIQGGEAHLRFLRVLKRP